MSFWDKIKSFIKNIFHKEELKMIEEIKQNIDLKKKFIESLKIDSDIRNKKIKTLICEGDGLGIQKNIKY